MPDRRALIVGINSYHSLRPLKGAVSDAEEIAQRLEVHQDKTPNYVCQVLRDVMEDGTPITRPALRGSIEELFADFDGEVLLYFSGHGARTDMGGYLCTTDAQRNDWGVPMNDVLAMAARSRARDILIILDCCHSGDMGNVALIQPTGNGNLLALLPEKTTVIAASRPLQAALEAGGHGLFTAAVLDALDGGAADHMGWVTGSAIYAYVERRFGAWDPCPVYKAHTSRVVVVRECAPLIERLKLHELVDMFPTPDYKYLLDPEHEPEDEHGNLHEPVNEAKRAIALLLKEFRDAGLIKPTLAGEQLFWTARHGHTVELTQRGREYWMLVKGKKI